ncbi:MAG: methyltransferase domain-containing protein [Candidatus Aenigmatarchaeota archaeon]
MKVLLYTGGFHPVMPVKEAETLGLKVTERDGRLVVGTADEWSKLKRLGYAHLLLEWLGEFDLGEDLPFDAGSVIEGSVAARFKKHNFDGDFRGAKQEILHKLDPYMEDVDLQDPDTVLYFFIGNEKIYAGRLLHKFDPKPFQQRRNEVRPFSRPVSLPQRESRCWINLSKISEGGKLLDPFCGTGGVLIESSLLDLDTYGSDADIEMVEGCRINLDYFNLEAELKRCTVQSLSRSWEKKFDAIVTDPPYGIASKVGGERIEELYRVSLREFEKVLKKGKRCVIGAPKRLDFEYIVGESKTSFRIVEKFEEQVHGSLTREIFVLEKD